MPNATDFWGSKGGNGSDAACFNAASTTATCNSDGNGYIFDGAGDGSKTSWQHLQMAGLIEGAYNGDQDAVTVPGLTHYATIRNGIFATVTHPSVAASDTNYFPNVGKRDALYVGISDTQGIVTAEELWTIDKKWTMACLQEVV